MVLGADCFMMRTCLLLLLVIAVTASPIKDEETREMQELESLLRRVIGGEKAKDLSAPWLVALTVQYQVNGTTARVFCGGSLISAEWILTAAHCIYSARPEDYSARLADLERTSSSWDKLKGLFGDIFDEDELKDWNMKVDQIVVHPQYQFDIGPRKVVLNDIAMMHLSEPVPVDPNNVEAIQQVELASALDPDFPQDNQECMFTGWGCNENGGSVTDVAFQVMLPKVNDTLCETFWKMQTFTRFCAGHVDKGMGICQGDSGSPLVCKKGNRWVQAGIASFVLGSAPGKFPAVFTRVSAYSCWIKETISNN